MDYITQPPTKRRKSANGCSTCKIRKVKCDETKPHCQRCLSTGRVCDGYQSASQVRWKNGHRRPLLLLAVPMTQQLQTENDHRAFSNFVHFAPYLANFASAEIWNTYIPQMSHAESAIQQIILSIGHLLWTANTSGSDGVGNTSKEWRQQMVFYHYGKALHALISNPNPDVNIVLLSCLIFCLFEELQGNCYAALQHIVAGREILLRHLRSLKKSSSSSSSKTTRNSLGSIKISSTWNPLLAQLWRVFSQLEIHTAVLEAHTYNPRARLPLSGLSQQEVADCRTAQQKLRWEYHPSSYSSDINDGKQALHNTGTEEIQPVFKSITEASQHLAGIATICIADTRTDSLNEAIPTWRSNFLISSRETVLLNHWLEAFNHLMTSTAANDLTKRELVNSHILRTYHSCLTLLNRAKHMGQEAVFDDNIVVIDQTLFRLTLLIPVTQEELVPPLFFVATRCRVGYTRRRAVGLLRQCGLEGQFLADVAEHFIDMEESSQTNPQEDGDTGFPVSEISRLRLHGIEPAGTCREGQDQDGVFYLTVSRFPYYPRAPTTPLLVHLPIVRETDFFNRARPCLDRALRFQMYSLIS